MLRAGTNIPSLRLPLTLAKAASQPAKQAVQLQAAVRIPAVEERQRGADRVIALLCRTSGEPGVGKKEDAQCHRDWSD